jgi:hypothetical protein
MTQTGYLDIDGLDAFILDYQLPVVTKKSTVFWFDQPTGILMPRRGIFTWP